jgi:hypothetical protein
MEIWHFLTTSSAYLTLFVSKQWLFDTISQKVVAICKLFVIVWQHVVLFATIWQQVVGTWHYLTAISGYLTFFDSKSKLF